MQVVSLQLAKNCVFLLESDTLSLSSDFTLKYARTELVDNVLGASHSLSPAGGILLSAIDKRIRVQKLRQVAADNNIHPTQMNELLGFLNTIGALRVASKSVSYSIWRRIIQFKHLLYGVRYASSVWRRRADGKSLASAVIRVSFPVIVISLPVSALLWGSGLASAHMAITSTVFAISLFVSGVYIHEYAHLLVIKRSGESPILLQHGLRLGIVHRALSPRQEVISALAGPAAGISWCVAAGVVLALAGAGGFAFLSYIIAAFHIASFMPGYGDFQSIASALQNHSKGKLHEA